MLRNRKNIIVFHTAAALMLCVFAARVPLCGMSICAQSASLSSAASQHPAGCPNAPKNKKSGAGVECCIPVVSDQAVFSLPQCQYAEIIGSQTHHGSTLSIRTIVYSFSEQAGIIPHAPLFLINRTLLI